MIENNIVSAPISLSELATLLGCTQDVGTICKSTNINMWAKYKPFKDASIEFATLNDRNSAIQSINYAIKLYKTNTLSNVPNIYSSVNKPNYGWRYERPIGDTPFRIGDFRGYKHNAVCPFNSMVTNAMLSGSEYRININKTLSVNAIVYDTTTDSNSLSFADFAEIGNSYFGILLYNSSTSKYYVAIDDETIASSNGNMSINVQCKEFSSLSAEQSWRVFPIIVTKDSASGNVKYYYSVPNLTPVTIKVYVSADQELNLNATKLSAGVKVSLTAKSATATYLTNCKLKMRHSSSAEDAQKLSDERDFDVTYSSEIKANTLTTILNEVTYTLPTTLVADLVIYIEGTLAGVTIKDKIYAKMNPYVKPDLKDPDTSTGYVVS